MDLTFSFLIKMQVIKHRVKNAALLYKPRVKRLSRGKIALIGCQKKTFERFACLHLAFGYTLLASIVPSKVLCIERSTRGTCVPCAHQKLFLYLPETRRGASEELGLICVPASHCTSAPCQGPTFQLMLETNSKTKFGNLDMQGPANWGSTRA